MGAESPTIRPASGSAGRGYPCAPSGGGGCANRATSHVQPWGQINWTASETQRKGWSTSGRQEESWLLTTPSMARPEDPNVSSVAAGCSLHRFS